LRALSVLKLAFAAASAATEIRRYSTARTGGTEMTRAVATLAVAAALALPGVAAAQVEDPGSGGSSTACAYGNFVTGQSLVQSGWIPYSISNSYVQLKTTVQNIGGGFFGSFAVSTSPFNRVSSNSEYYWPWRTVTLHGPTYTTGYPNTTGIPFTISLDPGSSAWSLYWTVCA